MGDQVNVRSDSGLRALLQNNDRPWPIPGWATHLKAGFEHCLDGALGPDDLLMARPALCELDIVETTEL